MEGPIIILSACEWIDYGGLVTRKEEITFFFRKMCKTCEKDTQLFKVKHARTGFSYRFLCEFWTLQRERTFTTCWVNQKNQTDLKNKCLPKKILISFNGTDEISLKTVDIERFCEIKVINKRKFNFITRNYWAKIQNATQYCVKWMQKFIHKHTSANKRFEIPRKNETYYAIGAHNLVANLLRVTSRLNVRSMSMWSYCNASSYHK